MERNKLYGEKIQPMMRFSHKLLLKLIAIHIESYWEAAYALLIG